VTPRELLAGARTVVTRRSSATRGVWARAAVLLARQALEQAIVEREPRLADAPGRVRMLALRALVDDGALAGEAAQVWGALSRATHHHDYELPPTAVELDAWFADVERLLDALAPADAGGAGR
jgi:hypothetical protein